MTSKLKLLVNIDVADVERAIRFYCSAFDLRVGRRFGRAVELVGASSDIYLLEKPSGSAATSSTPAERSYARHWTPVHLDFIVPSIEAAVERAERAGAKLEVEVRTHAWGRIAVMADPFGNGFCLVQFLGRGYDEIKEP